MRRYILLLLSISIAYSCEHRKGSVDVSNPRHINIQDGDTIPIHTDACLVGFTGRKTFVGTEHDGYFKLKEGYYLINANKIVGGKFVIDMPSLWVIDLDVQTKKDIINSLISEDLLDVQQYPTAVFEIDTVIGIDSSYQVGGNFTLCGQTRYISIPAIIKIADNKINTVANFSINRKDWEVYYKQEGSMSDKMISGQVGIHLNLNSKLK